MQKIWEEQALGRTQTCVVEGRGYWVLTKISVCNHLSRKLKETFSVSWQGYRYFKDDVKNPFKTISLDLFDLGTFLE